MRKIIATLIICMAILSSCKSKKENIASKYLNAGNLQEQLFTIDINKDTNLITQQGLKIKIDANSIEASTPTVTIQVKEALTLEAMLKAGLTTQTANGILSSDGMFNISTKEESKIKKPLGISVPTIAVNKVMQLFKGKEENNNIVWEEPKPIEMKTLEEPIGKALFMQNCASCHKVDQKLTGPPLAWTDQRFGKDSIGKQIVYQFINNPAAAAVSTSYYCNQLREYGTIMTGFDGLLSDKDYDAIYQYVNVEARKLNIPETAGYRSSFRDSCYYHWKLYQQLYNKKDSLMGRNEPMTSINILPSVTNVPVFPNNVDTSRPISQPRDYVVPDIKKAAYYQVNIEAYGWYNIDVLLEEDDSIKESSLMVRLQMPVALKASIFLVIPDKKVFIEGGLLKDTSSYGFYSKEGKIPLPQGQTMYLFAVGESGDKIYFSQTSFIAGLSQSINLELKETNKTTMVNAIAQLKLTDIKVEVKEVKNYKGIKALDSELERLRLKLKDCDCGARDTGGFGIAVPSGEVDGGNGTAGDFNIDPAPKK
jgi:mono/diheme cytochrome c family protein